MSLDPHLVHAAADIQFRNGTEIVNFFQQVVKAHFVDWFNTKCARRACWKAKALESSPPVKDRFLYLWNQIPLIFENVPINLLQFAALMSIIINEAAPDLSPVAELCGRESYPGLAYAFEDVPGIKRSYNCSQENKPAGELFFADEDFWIAHGRLPVADLVRALPDVRELWNGSAYPRNLFPTSLDPAHSAFIQQADFFKFRGRGLIQTTWRTNYKLLVKFVQNFTGNNPIISRYKAAWAGKDPDFVCTVTTNEDWDTLFEQTDLIIPARAIGLHNEMHGRYLNLSTNPATLAARTAVPGSLFNMGLRIGGAPAYASLFSGRIVQLLKTLAYKGH